MDVKERITALLEKLNEGIYEKEEVMALSLLSSIAGESIFLLGPPGGGKKPDSPPSQICL
jgi:MoxR-like ATPase